MDPSSQSHVHLEVRNLKGFSSSPWLRQLFGGIQCTSSLSNSLPGTHWYTPQLSKGILLLTSQRRDKTAVTNEFSDSISRKAIPKIVPSFTRYPILWIPWCSYQLRESSCPLGFGEMIYKSSLVHDFNQSRCDSHKASPHCGKHAEAWKCPKAKTSEPMSEWGANHK